MLRMQTRVSRANKVSKVNKVSRANKVSKVNKASKVNEVSRAANPSRSQAKKLGPVTRARTRCSKASMRTQVASGRRER